MSIINANGWGVVSVKTHIKHARELVERGLDKNIRVCITGLSGAGKTAFITSFINQLVHQKNSKTLPFWLAHADSRVVAAKLVPYNDMHIPEFPYSKALNSIESGCWPDSTSNISQARISIKYKIKNKWLKKIQSYSYLNVDIVDYPGEWLLDLPLLNLDYNTWSQQFYQWASMLPQSEMLCGWLERINSLDISSTTESDIKRLSKEFRETLRACKSSQKGIHFIQPGRFVLPGDLDSAPVLDFFPLLIQKDTELNGNAYILLEKRYNYYKEHIVKPFFKEYFSKVDRQLMLVDVLKVLNQGFDSYKELQSTLSKLVTSFNYGQSNWLKRMFQPQINRLVIASSKSDHVPPDQHNALKVFLTNMLRSAENQVGYQGVQVNNLAFSAIRVTEPVIADHDNKKLTCVKGYELGTQKKIVNYPGIIPTEPMSQSQWANQEFNFVEFAIPELTTEKALPHHRMDRVIELLIGDKFL